MDVRIDLETPDRPVAELMTSDPIVVPADSSVEVTAEILDSYRISGAPVVNDAGRIVGVISQTDLVRLRADGPPARAWHAIRAGDLMTSPVVTIEQRAPISAAARLMTEARIHRLVVVDELGEAVGVVSESDVVREIAEGCDE